MHTRNLHRETSYSFKELQLAYTGLKEYVFTNSHGSLTIDFANPKAVIALNKALLIVYYNVIDWELPEGFLCPPIPSRVDYVHHIADLFPEHKNRRGLDIGTGANAIYVMLGAQVYDWNMTGCDINLASITAAKKNISFTPALQEKVSIIHQTDNASIFTGIIKESDFYDFTMCNPPFHTSEKEAMKGTERKLKNLQIKGNELNFGGQANELWCNGGEALFLKRMIKQSVLFKKQVGYFTSLISKKETLTKVEKQLSKLKASFKVIPMEHGNKKTRILVWSFMNDL
ncbi:23S rRNA (adenine(1618)-N(6))-methyltransferase RlmF [Tenacibaculum amylolyticum]|uniref:23S rRNA (adenine(1618)-N(6))-methyltransferase RlmF n=1 Tax=Tenacibaculum amylolyticum TaxID=104269 RepID=UPI0038935BCB